MVKSDFARPRNRGFLVGQYLCQYYRHIIVYLVTVAWNIWCKSGWPVLYEHVNWYTCLDVLQIPDPFYFCFSLFPYFTIQSFPKQSYWLQIIEKGMASSRSAATLQSAAETATILESLEDAYPQPTLRLRLQNQTGEKSSEEIEREATEALEKLLKELEQASSRATQRILSYVVFDRPWMETLRHWGPFWRAWCLRRGTKQTRNISRWPSLPSSNLKTKTLKNVSKTKSYSMARPWTTSGERCQCCGNWCRSSQVSLLNFWKGWVYTVDYTVQDIGLWFFEKVKCYLVESWKMMLAGSTEEEMKEFRKKQRKEASQHFDKRVADLKEKMKEKAIEFSSDWKGSNNLSNGVLT